MWWCSYNSLNRLKHHLVVYLKQVNFMVCKLYLNKALLKKEKRLNIWDRYAGLPISQVWKPQKGEAHRHSARKWRSWVWNLQGCALDHWALLLPKVCLGSALHLSGASNSQVWCQTLASYNNCSLDDEGRGRRQCFLLLFSIVSWWDIPPDFLLYPPTAVVDHVVWKKISVIAIKHLENSVSSAPKTEAFFWRDTAPPPFSLTPKSPTPSPKLTNLHVSQVSIRWEVNDLFFIILWESDLIYE